MSSPTTTNTSLFRYTLALGDDALILAQRCGEWIAAAPELEEDVALANIGLDLLGQARMLLSYAGEVEGRERNEDDLSYLRDERDFTNLQICELDNGDFAVTTARFLIFSSYQLELYQRLASSADQTLAAIAAKAVKEVSYHRDHASRWALRLGDGTDESHARMQQGVEQVWPYLEEIFDDSWIPRELLEEGVAVATSDLRSNCDGYLLGILSEATLTVPEVASAPTGGRRGVHTEVMGFLLAEMQHIHRSFPGASW